MLGLCFCNCLSRWKEGRKENFLRRLMVRVWRWWFSDQRLFKTLNQHFVQFFNHPHHKKKCSQSRFKLQRATTTTTRKPFDGVTSPMQALNFRPTYFPDRTTCTHLSKCILLFNADLKLNWSGYDYWFPESLWLDLISVHLEMFLFQNYFT